MNLKEQVSESIEPFQGSGLSSFYCPALRTGLFIFNHFVVEKSLQFFPFSFFHILFS
jgi:hypothetical protein